MDHAEQHHSNSYFGLVMMSVGSFVAMYILMYAMVDVWDHAYPNINQGYMAALMTAPMILLEIAIMRRMYPDKQKNILVGVIGLLLLIIPFYFIRKQTAVGDEQFLRSMIPHHSGAILMCQQASLHDPEIQELCQRIIQSQQEEINQMQDILERRD